MSLPWPQISQIYKPPSSGRSVLNDIKILRGKEYKVDNAEQFARPPDRHLVDSDPFRAVLFQMHVDLESNPFLFHDRLEMGLVMPELYDIPVLCPPVGLRCSGQIESLEYIRLSLGIIPIQNISLWIKGQI